MARATGARSPGAEITLRATGASSTGPTGARARATGPTGAARLTGARSTYDGRARAARATTSGEGGRGGGAWRRATSGERAPRSPRRRRAARRRQGSSSRVEGSSAFDFSTETARTAKSHAKGVFGTGCYYEPVPKTLWYRFVITTGTKEIGRAHV